MKKLIFISAALFLSSVSFGQMKLGLKLSPNLSWNRVIDPSDSISGRGLALRSGGGAFLDFMFSDNYAFTTGITYTTKGAGTRTVDTLGNSVERKVSLQYLEIPIALKLFTNEIGTDMRLYFQVGATLNTNLAAKVNGQKSSKDGAGNVIEYSKFYNFFDLSALAAAGVEMQMGGDTWFFGGLSYNRGLINAVNKKNYIPTPPQNFQFMSEYLAIDLGLKF